MDKKLRFDVTNFEIDSSEISSINDSQFVDAEIEAFSTGENLHELSCSEAVLKKTASTIYEKPVVFELDKNFYDFKGHPDEEEKRSIGGFVVPGSATFFKRPDGRTALKVRAKIWKLYAQRFLEVFKMGGNAKKSVSVEMLMEEPTAKNEMTGFAYTAVCVLGDFTTPASPDANVVLAFSQEEKANYQRAFQAEFAKYSSLDFSIPEDVKSNCRDGLAIRNEFGTGGTSVSLAMARFLIKNETITPDRARKVFKYFSAKGRVKPEDNTSRDWVSWQLYGGEVSKEWANTLVDEMGVIDESIASYFEEIPVGNDADGREENRTDMSEKNKDEQFESEEEAKDEDVMMEEEEDKSEEMAEEEDKGEKSEEMAEEEEAKDEEMAEEDEEAESEDMEQSPEGQLLALQKEFEDASAKIESLEADVERLETENVELAEFKAEIEQGNFELEVDKVLEVVKSSFTDEELETAKADALENFTLETIGAWSNTLKATAFENGDVRKVKGDDEKKDGITKIDVPRTEPKKRGKKSHGLWANVSK